MFPTKERNLRVSGTDETSRSKGERFPGDSVPRPLGFIAFMPIPEIKLPLGLGVPNPSLVLAPELALRIAVGMIIADHPPHRSVLAELPHTAPPLDTSVEALIGIGMKSTRARNPSIKDRPQLFPIGLPPLTATT